MLSKRGGHKHIANQSLLPMLPRVDVKLNVGSTGDSLLSLSRHEGGQGGAALRPRGAPAPQQPQQAHC